MLEYSLNSHLPNTIRYPGTMMVKLLHTVLAIWTVFRSYRSNYLMTRTRIRFLQYMSNKKNNKMLMSLRTKSWLLMNLASLLEKGKKHHIAETTLHVAQS